MNSKQEVNEHLQTEPKAPSTELVPHTTGCRDLDERVFSGPNGRLCGGVVGISSDGDVGLVLALQMVANRLLANTAATARLVTTHPVVDIVRLLKGVLTAGFATADRAVDRTRRTDLLRRVLISRIYAPEDLWAVISEFEAAMPFRQLWSATVPEAGDGGGAQDSDTTASPPPSIIVITEMDHHFQWMRLQGPSGQRLHELYGRLMRRLRSLAAGRRLLLLALNSTVMQRPREPAGIPAGDASGAVEGDLGQDEAHESPMRSWLPADATEEQRTDSIRLSYHEISSSQNVAPRYKSFMNYMCSLHVCLRRVAPDTNNAKGSTDASSLWLAAVEHDEAEIFQRSHERFGLVQFSHGNLRDAFATQGT